jgi:hypothetical protein
MFGKVTAGIQGIKTRLHFSRFGQFCRQATKRCLRTHPNTDSAGMLPFGPDPVWLGPPRLETAFCRRMCRTTVLLGRGIIGIMGRNASADCRGRYGM